MRTAFALALAAAGTAGSVLLPVDAQAGLPQDLQELSRSIQGSLPIKVDREKHLETVAAIQDTLIFKYKVTDESTFRDPRFEPARYRRAFLESQRSSMCQDAPTLELLRRGARFNYLMVGRDGRRLFDFTLTYEGCRGEQ